MKRYGIWTAIIILLAYSIACADLLDKPIQWGAVIGGEVEEVVVPFNPSQISNTMFWLRPDQTKVYKDAGRVANPADGEAVILIDDQSSQANHFDEGSSTGAITWNATGGPNSTPMLTFDTDAWLVPESGSTTLGNRLHTEPLSFFMVFRFTNNVQARWIFAKQSGDFQPGWGHILIGGGGDMISFIGDTGFANTKANDTYGNMPNYYSIVITYNGGGAYDDWTIYKDNVALSLINQDSPATGTSTNSVLLTIMGRNDGGSGSTEEVDLADFAYYEKELTTEDRTNLANYVATRYGL